MPQLVFTGLLPGSGQGVVFGSGALAATDTNGTPGLIAFDYSSGTAYTYSLASPGLAVSTGVEAMGPLQGLVLDGAEFGLSQLVLDSMDVSAGGSNLSTYLSPSAVQVNAAVVACTQIGGSQFVLAARPGGSEIGVWEIDPDTGDLVPVFAMPDTAQTYGAGVSALEIVEISGTQFLYAGSVLEHGITGYQIGADGSLTAVESFGRNESLPVQAVAALDSVTIGGTTFLVAASAGSSSLTVLEVAPDGSLVAREHLIDGLDTRFANVTALEAIEVGGWGLVLAAGSDMGLSLFALAPDGRLIHLESLADDLAMGLDRVTDLQAVLVGNQLEIFAMAQGDAGISQFSLDIGQLALPLVAGGGTLTGGAGADMLMFATTSGTMNGGAGDDILLDGGGSDTLAGGDGADIFVLSGDGMADTVTDFELGLDQLDLTDWGMLYHWSQLDIATLSGGGIRISFRDETLDIYARDGVVLLPGDVEAMNLTFLSRFEVVREFLPGPDPDPDTDIVGTNSDDTLIGSSGDDVFYGRSGADLMVSGGGHDVFWGAAGLDVVSYGGHMTGVVVNLSDSSLNQGPAADDVFHDIEGIVGSEADDLLTGTDQANWFDGGAGDDRIEGSDGNDTLYGSDGNDGLLGGAGDDLLYGGAGDDRLPGSDGNDTIYGGSGNDALGGGLGDDSLFGGDGHDRMGAGDGQDHLEGGEGNDGLAAGPGHDFLDGGAGDDRMAGSYGNDTLYGGTGNDKMGGGFGHDWIHAGAGDDTIGAGDHNDTVYGGSGQDFLGAGAGDDSLFGGDGDDTINAGEGNDWMSGGAGADLFIFNEMIEGERDTISDFEDGLDVIRMHWVPGDSQEAKFARLDISQVGANVEIELRGHVIVLQNIDMSLLDPTDFIFTGP